MRILRSAINILANVGGYLAAAALLLMTLGVTLDVLARFVLGSGTKLAVEYSGYLLVAIVILGIAHTHKENGHIRVDFFIKLLPRRFQIWIKIFGSALFLFYAFFLARLGWKSFLTSYQFNTTSRTGLDVAIWPYQLVIPVGLLLVCALLVVYLIDDIRSITAKSKTEA